jgi:hypothetical protein
VTFRCVQAKDPNFSKFQLRNGRAAFLHRAQSFFKRIKIKPEMSIQYESLGMDIISNDRLSFEPEILDWWQWEIQIMPEQLRRNFDNIESWIGTSYSYKVWAALRKRRPNRVPGISESVDWPLFLPEFLFHQASVVFPLVMAVLTHAICIWCC